METFEQLNAIFCKVFDDNDIKIAPEMTADDIDEWDSLSHVNLVVAIEKYFKIKFKTSSFSRGATPFLEKRDAKKEWLWI